MLIVELVESLKNSYQLYSLHKPGNLKGMWQLKWVSTNSEMHAMRAFSFSLTPSNALFIPAKSTTASSLRRASSGDSWWLWNGLLVPRLAPLQDCWALSAGLLDKTAISRWSLSA